MYLSLKTKKQAELIKRQNQISSVECFQPLHPESFNTPTLCKYMKTPILPIFLDVKLCLSHKEKKNGHSAEKDLNITERM